jgi:hypothetical protein
MLATKEHRDHKGRTPGGDVIRQLPDHVFSLLCVLSWLFLSCSLHAAEAKPFRMAITPFQNVSGRTDLDPLTQGLADLLGAILSSSKRVDVVAAKPPSFAV